MTWLAGQVDYLLFLTGLCTVVAGAAAIIVRQQGDRTLAWNPLSVGLLLLGAAAWAQLLGYSLGDPPWHLALQGALRLAAWVALLEFARRFLAIRSRAPWWITALPAVIALASVGFGIVVFSAMTHIIVALPAALLFLVCATRMSTRGLTGIRNALTFAATGLVVDAMVGTVVYGSGSSHVSFATILGVPAPAFVAVGSAIVAFGLLAYSAFSVFERNGSRFRLAPAVPRTPSSPRADVIRALSVLPVLTLIVAAGWVGTEAIGRFQEDVERDALVHRAATAAAAIETWRVPAISGTALDLGRPAHADLVDQLGRIRAANSDMLRVSILRRSSGTVRFFADSSAATAAPDAVVRPLSAALESAFSTRRPALSEPRAGSAGETYTAYAPMIDPGTGVLVGVVAVEIEIPVTALGPATARLATSALAGGASLLVFLFYAIAQITASSSARLAASEERVRTIIENAPDGIVALEPDTLRIVDVNPSAASMLDSTPAALLGTRLDEQLEPVGGGEFVLGDPVTAELRTRGAGARVIEVSTTSMPHLSGDIVLAFLHDVTERRTADLQVYDRLALEYLVRDASSSLLAAEAGEFDALIEQALASVGGFLGADRASVAAFSQDLDSMILTHRWTRRGRPERGGAAEVISLDGYDWLMARIGAGETVQVPRLDELPAEAAADRATLAARGVRSLLVVPMTSAWMAGGCLVLERTNGEMEWSSERVGLISVLADVFASALRRAHAEEEVAKLSLAVTQSPAATVITDEEGTIEYVNPRFGVLSGYRADELIGQNPRILKSGQMADETFATMWQTISSGRQWRGELVNKRKDGALYWVQASISPVRDARGLIHYVSVQEDISAIKEAEAVLSFAADAANAANRAKSDFLATMSHEIRTPMNAIIGMAELLDETPLDEEQQRYVRIFRSAGESLLTLVNDVLDLSKIEAEKLELDVREFDVEQLVEEAAEVLAVRAREKGLELLADIGAGVPTHVTGDPDRLRQVLVNLVGNALKFTSRGHVLVTVRRGTPGVDGEVHLTFGVEDTGVGITADKLSGIFEAFTQADSSTTRTYGGTGLGLTISRRLAQLMGGDISVTSTEGAGSTFSFEAVFGPADVDVSDDGRSGLEGARVLVVDDNAANRLIMGRYVEGAGAIVSEAVDGAAALEALCGAERFDAVLLDLRMPGMSGIEVTERALAELSAEAPRIVVVSSEGRPGDARRVREAGAHAFLAKPVRRRDLVSTLRSLLGRGPAQRDTDLVAHVVGNDEGRPARALRILLVEDTDDNRVLVGAYLKKTPHMLSFAEDGLQAVVACEAAGPGGFDLVLMDMQMPVMDGYSATREIRRLETAAGRPRTPIVALTAAALAHESREALEAGCDECLTKPIKKATLLEAIARYAEAHHV